MPDAMRDFRIYQIKSPSTLASELCKTPAMVDGLEVEILDQMC